VPSLYLLHGIFSSARSPQESGAMAETEIHFQDYNSSVLELVTLPNVLLTWCASIMIILHVLNLKLFLMECDYRYVPFILIIPSLRRLLFFHRRPNVSRRATYFPIPYIRFPRLVKSTSRQASVLRWLMGDVRHSSSRWEVWRCVEF
jgi:hypothetical protein